MDWDHFRILLALGKAGSVAGAARALGLDNSTVSRRLADLETAVGATLIVRGGREFALTAEGRAAYEAAAAIEERVSAAERAIRSAKNEVSGVVHVSAVPSLALLLSPVGERVRAENPGLLLDMTADRRLVDLAKGEADIAIRHARPSSPDLIFRKAFDIAFGVYASKSYVASHGLPERPEDLRSHRLVQFERTLPPVPWFAWIGQYANPDASTVRADSMEFSLNAIRAGEGIGVTFCVNGDRASDLVRVFPEPVVFAPVYFVHHESQRDSARIRAVLDALHGYCRERADHLAGKRPTGCASPASPAFSSLSE